MRIALIDDTHKNLYNARDFFKQAGHTVAMYTSARSFQRKVERDQQDGAFDIIICDWQMPRVTGIEFYQSLQMLDHAEDPWAALPFILWTADPSSAMQKQGAPEYIVFKNNMGELLELAEELCVQAAA